MNMDTVGEILCLNLLPKFSRRLNETLHDPYEVEMYMTFLWGLDEGFQSYAPFSEFLLIHISCDKGGINIFMTSVN